MRLSCCCAGCANRLRSKRSPGYCSPARLAPRQGDASRDALAHLDTKLRNTRCAPPEITLEAFLHRPQTGVPAARSLHHNLTAMLQEHRRAARRATAGQWVRHITSLLLTARWSDRSDTSSLLFQARETWDRMLDNVASLDFANSLFSYADFLATIERAAQEMIFAPESGGCACPGDGGLRGLGTVI